MVLGIHQYYCIATMVNLDFHKIEHHIKRVMHNRLGKRLKKDRPDRIFNVHGDIREFYFKSKQVRFVNRAAILPIGYVQTKDALHKKKSINKYTEAGRQEIHKSLKIDLFTLHQLMRNPVLNRSIEYADNRISLFSAQYGKCAVTGKVLEYDEIHCHHKLPVKLGGTDEYKNLVIVHTDIHTLIHATQQETIDKYMKHFRMGKTMLNKLNKLRKLAGNEPITI